MAQDSQIYEELRNLNTNFNSFKDLNNQQHNDIVLLMTNWNNEKEEKINDVSERVTILETTVSNLSKIVGFGLTALSVILAMLQLFKG